MKTSLSHTSLRVLATALLYVSYFVFAAALIPLFFWFVFPIALLLFFASTVMLRHDEVERDTILHPLFGRVLRISWRALLINTVLYTTLLLHSYGCYIAPLNREQNPIRELFHREQKRLNQDGQYNSDSGSDRQNRDRTLRQSGHHRS